MRTLKCIARFTAVMLMLSAVTMTGCAEKIPSYNPARPIMFLEEGTPVPYEGWLLPDDAFEFLMKRAQINQGA